MTPMKMDPSPNFETDRPCGSKFAVCGQGFSEAVGADLAPLAGSVLLSAKPYDGLCGGQSVRRPKTAVRQLTTDGEYGMISDTKKERPKEIHR